jgi:hypothetical protein
VVSDSDVFKGYKARYLGKRSKATGRLFGSHTGHHRTDLLISVKSVAPAGD